MKKRVFSLALTLVLCLGLCPAALGAETAEPTGWTITEVVPCKYDGASNFSEGLAPVKLNGKWGFIDKLGNEVVPCKYDDVYHFSEGLAMVKLNGKWGFIDKLGNEVAPCKYDDAEEFFDGLALVALNGKYGFIDKTGREVTACKYEKVGNSYPPYGSSCFFEGMAAVKLDGKWGFIDKAGNQVIPCKYGYRDDKGRPFSDGLAVVGVPDGKSSYGEPLYKLGFIDTTGREIVPPGKYAWVEDFSEGLAVVRQDGKYGFIDKTGKEVIPCEYDTAGSFSSGLAVVCRDRKYGFIDKTGKEVVPCKLDYFVYSFEENTNFAITETYNKYGLINRAGEEILPPEYEWPHVGLRGEWTMFYKEDSYGNWEYGFLDEDGNMVAPAKYEIFPPFDTEYANPDFRPFDLSQEPIRVSEGKNGGYYKYGYIDRTGKEVIPLKYDDAGFFSEGLAIVGIATGESGYGSVPPCKYGFIDKTGKEVVPCKYDDVGSFSEGLAKVALDGKWGFLSATENTAPAPTLSGSGTLGQADELAWEVKDSTLTVDGTLEAEDLVAAACQDEQGRFIGAAVVQAGQLSATLPEGTAAAKLFWLGAGLAPKCPFALAGEFQ